MLIVIPTYGRATRQITYNALPEDLREATCLVVQQQEAGDYAVANPDAKFIQLPKGISGIAATRDWLVEFAAEMGEDKLLMLDDDLVFAVRRHDEPTKLLPASGTDIVEAFAHIESRLDFSPMVGMSGREGANRNTDFTITNTRAMRVLGFDTSVLRKEGIRFSDGPGLMEDFGVTLALLTRGYSNVVLNWIVHNQPGSNVAGGCSEFRTAEKQEEAAIWLAKKYPDFVSVVSKVTKSSWGGGVRADVRIQWKSAAEFGRARRAAGLLDKGTGGYPGVEGKGLS